jgi:hypothetical protein
VSSNPAAAPGQLVTLTCTVASGAGTPTGSVTISNGTAPLATVSLSGGVGTYATSALAAGTYSLSCQYLGSASFAGSGSVAITQTVTSPSTTTTLSISPNPPMDDKPLTFTAIVTAQGATPTGTVTFYDGAKTIGTGAVVSTAGALIGKATLTLKSTSEGQHTFTAKYVGNLATSTSAPITVKVLEDYSCRAYQKPLVTGGTLSAPSRSGSFTFGSKVGVRWQFVKPTGAYVTRSTAVKALAAVYDAGCLGKPLAGAATIPLFDPATGPTAGSTFTWDSTAKQYYLNWDTSKASKGCWDIVLTPDNGLPRVATIVKLQ